MVEPFIAESRVSGSGEKVNGTVYAREVFECSVRSGESKVKFIECFEGGGNGRVGSMGSRYRVEADVGLVSGG